jgi:hypothetical protein
MAYSKRIICLANSYKPPSGRCVAGIELLNNGVRGGWIRPVSARPGAELTYADYRYQNGSAPALLDVMDISFAGQATRGHQTENHLIDPRVYWSKVSVLAWKTLSTIQDKPTTLWANVDHTSLGVFDCMSSEIASALGSSLLLIHVDDFSIEVETNHFSGKLAFRGTFTYKGTHHNFSVTDPRARDVFGPQGVGIYPIGEAYLCVSLTEPFEKDGRCHKLVAGILTKSTL